MPYINTGGIILNRTKSILKTSLGLNVIQYLSQFFILESTFKTWYQSLGFFWSFGTQIGELSKLELVNFLLGEQTSHGRYCFPVAKATESLAIVKSFHEYFRKLLFFFCVLVLGFSVLQ